MDTQVGVCLTNKEGDPSFVTMVSQKLRTSLGGGVGKWDLCPHCEKPLSPILYTHPKGDPTRLPCGNGQWAGLQMCFVLKSLWLCTHFGHRLLRPQLSEFHKDLLLRWYWVDWPGGTQCFESNSWASAAKRWSPQNTFSSLLWCHMVDACACSQARPCTGPI